MLTGPILPTLLRLAAPNVLAMSAATAVGIAETAYIGALGRDALAGMALVFPFVMLMQMFSAGAMGGGVSSAISRALGAGDTLRAQTLALHALIIGAAAGAVFTVLLVGLGPSMYQALGGREGALREASSYGTTVFAGTLMLWVSNSLVSVLRGTGDMRTPSAVILAVCVLQVLIGAGLGLGLAGLPRLGMAGVGLGLTLAASASSVFLLWYLMRPGSRIRLRLHGVALRREMFTDILRVGALACLSPLQTVATILVFTALVARHGVDVLAGYGIGSRLEFLLVPIAFGVGVAAVPMVGMAIGAGDVARARRVAWTAAAVSAALLGSLGLLFAIWPLLWAGMFTSNAAVLAAASQYLRLAGPAFAFFGVGLTLYFASQGARRVLGPVLASTLRFALVLAGGLALLALGAPAWTLFALVGVGMVVYGLATAWAVRITPW